MKFDGKRNQVNTLDKLDSFAFEDAPVKVGSSSAAAKISDVLRGTVSWNPGSTPSGNAKSQTMTITGAALGDVVKVSFDKALGATAVLTAEVSTANTVRAVLVNLGSTINPGAGTLTFLVLKSS